MQKIEKWVEWIPPEEQLSSIYYCEAIVDHIDTLEILLSDYYVEDKKIRVLFQSSVLAYRTTDETHFQETASRVTEFNEGPYYGKGAFFTVESSEFIEWLVGESEGAIAFDEVIHFLIRTENSYIEIVSSREPKLKFIG